MDKSINILSTKKLNHDQLSIFKDSIINIIDTDFIETREIEFNTKELEASSKNWIITSKKSFEIILKTYDLDFLKTINYFCIGDKTASVLKSKGLKVVIAELNSKELGNSILTNYNNIKFTFIAGSYRRAELPSILKENNIDFNEFTVYETIIKPQKIDEHLEGVLFFSPSGIQSYMVDNKINKEVIFCIGETTATEAKKYSTNINISTEQTFESVLKITKTYFS
jgi:uroporphyrinogen-III synthase